MIPPSAKRSSRWRGGLWLTPVKAPTSSLKRRKEHGDGKPRELGRVRKEAGRAVTVEAGE